MSRTFLAAFSTVLALTACDQSESTEEATSSFRSTPSDEDLEDMFCAPKRQIAIKTTEIGSCPSVDGWTASYAFPGASGALKKFCKYDWDAETTPDIAALLAKIDLVEVASDCAVVFEQSNPVVWNAVGPDVEQAFHHGIGRASASDLDLANTEDDRHKVAVAVVDSVPEPAPSNPRSVHGEMMVDLINDIACPAGIPEAAPPNNAPCEVKVRRSLGLPRYDDGQVDLVRGGYFGSQFDIARAIFDSVQTWKATNWGDEPAKLIINLSVGWNGNIYGDLADPRVSVQAVHRALEYAACHDVAVIAAAGNMDYTCLNEPLLPAAWHAELAPSAAECETLFPAGTWTDHGTRPLVYAVGGLKHDREKMTYSIPNSMPALAALATNGVAGGSSFTLTGTSVAAAVTTGALALVWSYNPDLTSAEAMTLLYQHGAPTPLDVEFPTPSSVDVRAVNACAALDAACDRVGANCPFQSQLACVGTPAPVAMEDVFSDIEAAATRTENSIVVGVPLQCSAECSALFPQQLAPQAVFVGAGAPQACPEPMSLQLPFTLPQPLQIGCPNCTLDVTTNATTNETTYKVYASIDDEYQNHTIDDVTIAVKDTAGQTTYFRYGPLLLYVDHIKEIQLDPTEISGGAQSASISILFNDGDANTVDQPVVDPLLIGPQ